MISKEEYDKMKSDSLPYTTKWGYILTDLKVECSDCHKTVEDLKYHLIEYNSVLEVRAVGLCYACHSVINGHLTRIYDDGRVTWRTTDGTWVQRIVPFKERLRQWIRRNIGF